MSELKSFIVLYDGKFIRAYEEPEADKVIVEKDAEIAELKSDIADLRDDKKLTDAILDERNSEIAELKAQKAQAEDDCAYWKMSEDNAANAMHETEEYAMQLYKELRHQKYKRCLAMVEMLEHICPTTIRKAKWKGKWHLRWLALAEKFKEAK